MGGQEKPQRPHIGEEPDSSVSTPPPPGKLQLALECGHRRGAGTASSHGGGQVRHSDAQQKTPWKAAMAPRLCWVQSTNFGLHHGGLECET